MDIQKALSDLSRSGLTDAEIGRRVSLTQPTICRLRNGVHASTSYENGAAIFALHRNIMARKRK